MTIRLTPTQSRLAAIALLVLALALAVALFAVPALWLNKRYDAYLDDYTDRLQRYLRVAALRPAVEEATVDVLKRDGRKYYLRGPSPTLAAAELQTLVTRIIERHKGRIASSQVLPDKEEAKTAGPLKVTIHVQMAASIVPLQFILHALETNEPYLFIEKVTLVSSHGRAYKPEPGVQPEFTVQLTLSGYALPEGAH